MTAIALPGVEGARRALLGAATFGVLWTVIEVTLGGMLRQSYNPIEVVWWRYGVHLLVIAALWGFTRRREVVSTRRPVFHLARSLLMLTMPGAYVVSLYAGVPTEFMWSAFWTTPAAIMIVSWLWLRERPSPLWLGLAVIGALASAMIYGHVRPPSLIGVACAAVMQLSFVLYYVMTRALHAEHREANLFYTALGPFALMGAFMPMIWVTPSWHDVAVMTAIGLLGFVALYALDIACHTEPASVGAPGLFAHVPAVFVLSYVSQGFHMGPRAMAGTAALVLLLAAAWVFARGSFSMAGTRRE